MIGRVRNRIFFEIHAFFRFERGNFKVSFVWDLTHMSSNVFLPKKQASDWLTYQFYQLEAWVFLAGNHLNSYVSWLWSQKKLTHLKVKKKKSQLFFLFLTLWYITLVQPKNFMNGKCWLYCIKLFTRKFISYITCLRVIIISRNFSLQNQTTFNP